MPSDTADMAWEEYCRRVGMFMSQAEAHQAYLFGRRSRDAEVVEKSKQICELRSQVARLQEEVHMWKTN